MILALRVFGRSLTQCTRCGYPSCRDYAGAIASGEGNINQCPPGGTETIVALAMLTGRPVAPLSKDHGIESAPLVAFIESELTALELARYVA